MPKRRPAGMLKTNLAFRGSKNMMLGVMQPYFFPYLGYFDLINRIEPLDRL